ncbi:MULTISPECIES: nucleotidyltransferase [unclassified Curtobacterium]|uniref:nucleotidyltransferase n=1 Tax=unclassified Curtobacterium TaxID=257496 RepID=UPI001062F7C7|nr:MULTISPECIES: nucleotidyltransferase [unclassified Curtobacterium]
MTEDYRLLSGAEVVDLLGELLERLAGRGVEVETYIVGGAAVAVHLGRDEVTPDIDGLFQPMDEVLVEARAMAAEHRLDPEWDLRRTRGDRARSVRRAQHDASGRPSRGPADRRGGAPSG